MRREDVIAGLLLVAIPVAAGGRRALQAANDRLQDALAHRRYQPPVVRDARSNVKLYDYEGEAG